MQKPLGGQNLFEFVGQVWMFDISDGYLRETNGISIGGIMEQIQNLA